MLWPVAVLEHDKKLDSVWNSQARHLRNFFWGLRDHSGIDMQLIVPQGIAQCGFLLRITHIATFCSELVQHGVVNAI